MGIAGDEHEDLFSQAARVPVLPLGNALAEGVRLLGGRSVMPAEHIADPIGFLYPTLADLDCEFPIAPLRFLLHGHFDELNALFLLGGNTLDDLRRLVPVLREVGARTAHHDLDLSYC